VTEDEFGEVNRNWITERFVFPDEEPELCPIVSGRPPKPFKWESVIAYFVLLHDSSGLVLWKVVGWRQKDQLGSLVITWSYAVVVRMQG
jgi:hypothetical protein